MENEFPFPFFGLKSISPEMDNIISDIDFLCLLMVAGIWIFVLYIIAKHVYIPKLSRYSQKNNRLSSNVIEDKLGNLFSVVWCYGFITYFIGTFVGDLTWGTLSSVLSVVPMAILHATEMFAGVSDISAIHADRHESIIYMCLFNTSHFLAVLVSLLFLFKHVGYYLRTKIFLEKEEKHNRQYDSLYIFWNINEESLTLAKDIERVKAEQGDGGYRIVFINDPSDENYGSQRLSFSRIFNFIALRDRQLEIMEGFTNTLCISTYHKISEVTLENDNIFADVICNKLHLQSLAKLIERTNEPGTESTDKGIHIFFLGEDRDANTNSTINIIRDSLIKLRRTSIYCQTRRNAKTIWMEHYNLRFPKEKTDIHVIDTAYLSIAQLKQEPKYQPVRYIDIDKRTGLIRQDSKFSSVILGFGETGKEALRYLYEFGTFVDSTGLHHDGAFWVADDDMERLKGAFYAKAREMKNEKCVELNDFVIGSEDYWDKMNELLPTLNYVIIAMGDDNEGINTAYNLCTIARRLRDKHKDEQWKKLTIFVRSYENANLNRIKMVRDDLNLSCQDMNINVEIFGSIEQLFTYKMLVDGKVLREAKEYNYSYEKGTSTTSVKELENCWDEVLEIKKEDTPNYNMTELEEIERKQNQNICNSMHRHTKVYILKQCDSEMNVSNEVITNLAKLEHARWVACSKLDGWRRDIDNPKNKDLPKKIHCDVCEWDEIRCWDKALQKEVQSYDIKVVKTSIRLEKESNSPLQASLN